MPALTPARRREQPEQTAVDACRIRFNTARAVACGAPAVVCRQRAAHHDPRRAAGARDDPRRLPPVRHRGRPAVQHPAGAVRDRGAPRIAAGDEAWPQARAGRRPRADRAGLGAARMVAGFRHSVRDDGADVGRHRGHAADHADGGAAVDAAPRGQRYRDLHQRPDHRRDPAGDVCHVPRAAVRARLVARVARAVVGADRGVRDRHRAVRTPRCNSVGRREGAAGEVASRLAQGARVAPGHPVLLLQHHLFLDQCVPADLPREQGTQRPDRSRAHRAQLQPAAGVIAAARRGGPHRAQGMALRRMRIGLDRRASPASCSTSVRRPSRGRRWWASPMPRR